MVRNPDFSLKILAPDDAPALANLFRSQSASYLRGFRPFAFDETTLRTQLIQSKRDRFWGIYQRQDLIGLTMLRGFDEGYERPSFGVMVAETFRGRGAGQVALAHCLDWCEANDIRHVMLKVDKLNKTAANLYEANGFYRIDFDHDDNEIVMQRDIQS